MNQSNIAKNLERLNRRIEQACVRAGRNREEIRLIWVSKTRRQEEIMEALALGAGDFGENRVQEAAEKFPLPAAEELYRLHFIGRLQSNKVRKVIPLCKTIHSIDSFKLLDRVDAVCGELGVRRDIFFQVNVSGEGSKTGFQPEGFLESLISLPVYTHVNPIGLMTIGPYTDDMDVCRSAFSRLASLLQEIRNLGSKKPVWLGNLQFLSMGMSDDFEVAIEQGSHYIRIGTYLFGPRRE